MPLNPINYICLLFGSLNFVWLTITSVIVLKRNPQEKLNWLFASSFGFLAIAYAILPIGAFTRPENDPTVMLNLTKTYGLTLFIGLVLMAICSIAIRHGTQFVFRWRIIIPVILVILTAGAIIFAFNDTDGFFWSIKAVPGEGADTTNSTFFMITFYPLALIFIIITLVFFSITFREAEDPLVKNKLRFFLIGYVICISSLIPNIASSLLDDIWEYSQFLNGLEFLMVALGITLMSVGFLSRSVEEETPNEKLAMSQESSSI
ncbi:MAG: hypothetical protein GF308_08530 [Candidatus Heimdallarchaeota archaeon]|nr:hypothetical protein [Candidatus Heimdallarchaeota archaeon]